MVPTAAEMVPLHEESHYIKKAFCRKTKGAVTREKRGLDAETKEAYRKRRKRPIERDKRGQ